MVTDDCNFRCSYCPQSKQNLYLNDAIADKAVDFFTPFFAHPCYINFYGGEPLLGFDRIRHVVECLSRIERRSNNKFLYTITTNGSLIDDEVLRFFGQNKFSLVMSFDGLAQDISRQKGSFDRIVPVIKKLLSSPNVQIMVNSVFTPDTVDFLSKSVQFIMEMAVPNIDFTVSGILPWDELSILKLSRELVRLRKFTLKFFEETGTIPVEIFRERIRKASYCCNAGLNRMALAPDGMLWGCPAFHNYFHERESSQEYLKYSFGDLEYFIARHRTIYPKILKNYSCLRQDRYFTARMACAFCSELEECDACPIYSAFSTSNIGEIPEWICKIKKIFRQERGSFRADLNVLSDGL